MTNLVKRKAACSKCGSWHNYSCRTCVGCAKNKSKQQYTNRLYQEGKTRDTRRKEEFKKGNKVYCSRSTCKKCNINIKYVSSGSCTSCHRNRSLKHWRQHLDNRAAAIPPIFKGATKQLLFNSMMDYAGNKLFWYRDAMRAYPSQTESIEYVYNKGKYEKELIRSYQELADIHDFSNFKAYKLYKQIRRQYDFAPYQKRNQLNLLYAEAALYHMTEYYDHPLFPTEFLEYNPSEYDIFTMEAIYNADRKSLK